MPMYYALVVSISILAVVATWLFLGPLAAFHAQVWQAFIAWGCHYHSGGKVPGTRATIVCMSFGAVVGMAAVLLSNQIGALGALAAPVSVGIGAGIIVLASKVPWLDTVPASVYGFAAIAGLILLGTDMTAVGALLPTIVSIVIGAVFGYVSELIAGMLAKPEEAA
jgi:Protein of unknown function (DUF1097)